MKTFLGASLASRTRGARRPVRVLPRFAGTILAAGLSVAATPSLAQSYDPDIGTGNIVPYYGQQSNPVMMQNGLNAQARVSRGAARRPPVCPGCAGCECIGPKPERQSR